MSTSDTKNPKNRLACMQPPMLAGFRWTDLGDQFIGTQLSKSIRNHPRGNRNIVLVPCNASRGPSCHQPIASHFSCSFFLDSTCWVINNYSATNNRIVTHRLYSLYLTKESLGWFRLRWPITMDWNWLCLGLLRASDGQFC